MSWSYSGNPANSQIDYLRFMLGDTLENEPILQDEEIRYIADNSSDNEDEILYNLFTRAATLFARDIKRRLGPQSEDPTERLKFFSDKAKEYKNKLAYSGTPAIRNHYPKIFRKGMHNNPKAYPPEGGDYIV